MTTEQKDNTKKHPYPLRQLYFYLTEGCNLKCRHCWISPKFQASDKTFPSLERDLFSAIIKQAKPLGLTGVKLTGGEPLLHPQISDLLDVITSEELRLVIETNGTLCTPELAEKMKSASKNTFVSVSIDGVDAKTHEWVRGIEGSYEAAWNGVKNLVNAGLKPQIIMSIMQKNKGQMETIVQQAEKAGADSVKFNIVQPITRGEQLHDLHETMTIEQLVELGEWVENTLANHTKLRLIYSHPMAFRALGKMFGQGGDGCGICGILGVMGVLSNGSYAMCGIGESVPKLVYGHAAKDKLEEIWENAGMLKDLRNKLPGKFEGVCADCLMKGICLGSCVAQNYYRTGNIWASNWYCEAAKKTGLFPKTRLKPMVA